MIIDKLASRSISFSVFFWNYQLLFRIVASREAYFTVLIVCVCVTCRDGGKFGKVSLNSIRVRTGGILFVMRHAEV